MKTQPKLSEAQLYGKADTGSPWRSERIPQWGVNYLKTPGFGTRSTLTCMHIVTHWKNDCILWKDCLGFFFSFDFPFVPRERKRNQTKSMRQDQNLHSTDQTPLFLFLSSFFFFTHCSYTGSASWCSLRGVCEWFEERKWERLHFHRVYYRWALTASRCGNHGVAASRGWTDYCIWPNVYRTEYRSDICSG